VPLLAGEVVNAEQGGICASMNNIIDKLPQTIATAHVISSKGCTVGKDHLHFDAAGYRELGKRYAEAMLPLLSIK
jgi:lysophospholipase L1-like esterase